MINRKVLNDLKNNFLSRWKYSERKALSEIWDLHYLGKGGIGAAHKLYIVLQIKNGEIKVGDTIFYYPYEEFATIVELPSLLAWDRSLSLYEKKKLNVPSINSSKATVRISSGGTRKVDISTLWKWWHGNEKDEELHKQIAKKITDEDRDEAREIIEKEFKPYERDLPEFFGTMELTEITDNGIMKISVFGDATVDSDLRDMFHNNIESSIKLRVPVVKAVIVDFHSKDGSSHIVVGT